MVPADWSGEVAIGSASHGDAHGNVTAITQWEANRSLPWWFALCSIVLGRNVPLLAVFSFHNGDEDPRWPGHSGAASFGWPW